MKCGSSKPTPTAWSGDVKFLWGYPAWTRENPKKKETPIDWWPQKQFSKKNNHRLSRRVTNFGQFIPNSTWKNSLWKNHRRLHIWPHRIQRNVQNCSYLKWTIAWYFPRRILTEKQYLTYVCTGESAFCKRHCDSLQLSSTVNGCSSWQHDNYLLL